LYRYQVMNVMFMCGYSDQQYYVQDISSIFYFKIEG